MAKLNNWIPENEAAEKLRRKPRTLRKLVKSGNLNISFTNVNGRSFYYSENDIKKLLDNNASLVIN